ncbi:MAG: FecR family protein [Rufibacter sp.]
MNRDASYFWDLTAKHLSGTSTPEEEGELTAWLQEDAQNQHQFEEQRRLWQISEKQPKNAFSPQAGWQEFLQRVQAEQQKVTTTQQKSYGWLRVAAGFAVLLVSVFLVRYFLFSNAEIIVVAATEAKREVVLPDSSHVWLNQGSQLSYTSDFNEENRQVTLQGEGYFEVQHNPAKPFTVTASKTQTQVLGTTFQVSAQEPELVEVVLFTGKVAFQAQGNPEKAVTLEPGQKALFSASAGTITVSPNEDENALAWKEEKLVFKNTPLAQVAQTLKRFYGITLTFENPALAQCHFTGTFKNKPKLEEVLLVMTRTLQLSYLQVQPNVYQIKGQGCS